MTRDARDPFLAEVAKALSDVDVVAIAAPDPGQLPASLDGAEAEQASRRTMHDLVDAVVGVWEVVCSTETPPLHIQTQWFTHPTGDLGLVQPQAWIRHHVDDILGGLVAAAAELDGRGWRVATDLTSAGGRLRGRNGHVYVELQRRSGGLVLLRAQSGYLSLGELSSELVAAGTGEQPWP